MMGYTREEAAAMRIKATRSPCSETVKGASSGKMRSCVLPAGHNGPHRMVIDTQQPQPKWNKR